MDFIGKALWGSEEKTPGSVIAPAPAPPDGMVPGAIAPVAAAPPAPPAAAPAALAIAVPVPVAAAAAPAPASAPVQAPAVVVAVPAPAPPPAKPQRNMAELILGLVLVFVGFLTTILAWAAAGSWWATFNTPGFGDSFIYLSFICLGSGAGAVCTNYNGTTVAQNNLRGAHV
jgi:hypothetical protein